MRIYTQQHQFYCGIDLHARTMYLCSLNQEGAILVHRHMPAGPDPFLQVIAPYREDLVVCVACIFTWYWLADRCAREGMPCVLGHALSMQAMHGGKATNDRIDAQTSAVSLRGGMLPQASVYPAAMRAARDVLRRRIPLMRTRAELLTHSQHTKSQYTWPEMGKQIAYKANRDGVAERFADPAVPKSMEVDLALIDHDDRLLRDRALTILTTAQQHDANTRYLLRTVPGIGEIVRLVLLYEIHDIDRFPRVQDCVSYCRLVKCAKASAGTRDGTSGTKIGHASLTWAFSEAALLFLRNHPHGQQSLTRLEQKHGKGQALTVLAPTLARAASSMLQRQTALHRQHFLQSAPGAERMRPPPHWPIRDESASRAQCWLVPCVANASEHSGR